MVAQITRDDIRGTRRLLCAQLGHPQSVIAFPKTDMSPRVVDS
jgi:hypothetical protein